MKYSKTLRNLIQIKGHKIKVNENGFLVFQSKEHYKNIKRLEKNLFDLVRDVMVNGINEEKYERERARKIDYELKCKYKYGCEYESEDEKESESEKLSTYNMSLANMIYSIEMKVEKFPLTKVNIFELEENKKLDDPFEIKFPTLVYFFMTNHKKEEGYSNYKLFSKKIKSRELESHFNDLRIILRETIQVK